MKITRFLTLVALIAVVSSCSKDEEDPKPAIEEASLSFSQNSEVLAVPEGMLNSDNPYAQMAAGWIEMANGMSANLALFTPPAGAKKSTEIIVPVNGRAKASSGIVYTWSDPSYGSVAYQVRDDSDKYIFELFYKGNSDAGWYRYLYAQELKDRSAGYMALYDAWGSMTDSRDAQLIRWDWSRQGDDFTFQWTENESGTKFVVKVNTKTKAGSVVFYESNVKIFEITWDTQGKGTWKQYDSGKVSQEGSWD